MNVSHLTPCVRQRCVVLLAFAVALGACQSTGTVDDRSAAKGRKVLEVMQRESQFVHNGTTVWSMNIQVNDTVIFRNDDEITHSLYSDSEIKSFKIGQTRRGESGQVMFDSPGVVMVKCDFHPAMRFELNVMAVDEPQGKY